MLKVSVQFAKDLIKDFTSWRDAVAESCRLTESLVEIVANSFLQQLQPLLTRYKIRVDKAPPPECTNSQKKIATGGGAAIEMSSSM